MFKRSLHLLFSLSSPRVEMNRAFNDFLSLLLPRLDATRFDSSVEWTPWWAPCFWLQRGLKALKRIARNAEIREEGAARIQAWNLEIVYFRSLSPWIPRKKNLRISYLTRRFIYWKISTDKSCYHNSFSHEIFNINSIVCNIMNYSTWSNFFNYLFWIIKQILKKSLVKNYIHEKVVKISFVQKDYNKNLRLSAASLKNYYEMRMKIILKSTTFRSSPLEYF